MSEPRTPPKPDDPIGEEVARLARRKARSLVGCAGLTHQDREDVEQELFLRVTGPLRALPPTAAGRLVYAQRLVDRFALNLLRARRAAKRAGSADKVVARVKEWLGVPDGWGRRSRPAPARAASRIPHCGRHSRRTYRSRWACSRRPCGYTPRPPPRP